VTTPVTISGHAVDRYLERIDGQMKWHEAEAELRSHSRVISVAADFGCECVKLANGARLILDGACVVTVLVRGSVPHVRSRLAA